MTAACPGQTRGIAPHDTEEVAVRIDVPWAGRPGPVQVLVVHRCDTWGCNERGVEWTEPAIDADGVLRRVLEPRGMLGCSHTLGRPTYLKGCLPGCRAYDSPEQGGTAGARYAHAPGCGISLAGLANGHLEAARQAYMADAAAMAEIRDAPRPEPGAITSDPDAFLRRATRRRGDDQPDGRPLS